MHMRGTPRSMQAETTYTDVVAEVVAFLREQVERVTAAGIAAERLVVDCGIGFAKGAAQNLELLARHEELLAVGRPVLSGWSRKSTLARVIGLGHIPRGQRSPAQLAALDAASAAAAVLAVQRGASIVRVHDVAATVAALAIARAAAQFQARDGGQ
jgi:dihydropteroate synthase